MNLSVRSIESFLFPEFMRRYTNYKGGAPFMAKVELKKPVVEEISDHIQEAQAVVLVTYCRAGYSSS